MLNKIITILGVILVSVIIVAILYLTFNPLYFSDVKTIISPRYIKDMTYARTYYQTLSSISGILFGMSGVILGCFYYFHKIETDKKIASRERQRKRVDTLIADLKTYDDLVCSVINKNFEKENELKLTRHRIIRIFDNISRQLEVGDALLQLKDDEIGIIMKVHSFVEKSPLLNGDLSKINDEESIWYLKDKYNALIHDAQKLCYIKLA